MRKRVLLSSALALTLAAPPASADYKKLFKTLGKGATSTVIGGVALEGLARAFDSIGVFDALGVGDRGEAETQAKLDKIIAQLDQVHADIEAVKDDVNDLNATVQALANAQEYLDVLGPMRDAQDQIETCAEQLGFLTQNGSSDDNDEKLLELAAQMVGRGADGPCSLTTHFKAIHARIVPDETGKGAYKLLAQVAREATTGAGPNGNLPFEVVAGHYIGYALTQRHAFDMIRNAYAVLGEMDNFNETLRSGTAFLTKLEQENIAFLEATDIYVTHGSPPYDPTPAAFSDAVVQRFEGVRNQLTTFSLGLLPQTALVTPNLKNGSDVIELNDSIDASGTDTYYHQTNIPLIAGNASCTQQNAEDGFSWVRPDPSGYGFLIGSSCDLRLTRQLLRQVPTNLVDWQLFGRTNEGHALTQGYRNAATLADENLDANLALGGDPAGRATGASEFLVVPDHADVNSVSFEIDLAEQGRQVIRRGRVYPLTASGDGEVAWFTKIHDTPENPDRYALMIGDQYLSIGSDGFAILSDTATYFDFKSTGGDRTELVYDGGVLYVNDQLQQIFFGESPEDKWANSVNVAQGAQNLHNWGVPVDGVPRAEPDNGLQLSPPCLDASGTPTTFQYDSGVYSSWSTCVGGLVNVIYKTTFNNESSAERKFKITTAATATLGFFDTLGNAGVHCYQPNAGAPMDHLDYGPATVSIDANTVVVGPATFVPDGPGDQRDLTLAPGATLELWCQYLDFLGNPANMTISEFTVSPCKQQDGTCEVYP